MRNGRHISFFINRKKCLIFTHKETLYSFLILDVKKKGTKNINHQIIYELKKQLTKDGINQTKALSYFGLFNHQEIFLLKTDNDQKTLGPIRDLIRGIKDASAKYSDNKIVSTLYFTRNNTSLQSINTKRFHEKT